MALNKVEAKVLALIETVIREIGYEIVELKYEKEAGHWYLRIFIDKRGGINIDDCSLVSEKVSNLLDEEDPIPNQYFLEVSSPGIFRPLTKPADFERFKDEQVEISLFAPQNGKKRWIGKLMGLLDNNIIIISDKGGEISFPYTSVSRVQLHPDL